MNKNQMEVYIITEGNKEIGFGHLTRCISIYQAFEARGVLPNLIIHGDETIKDIIKDKRYDIFNWIKEKEKLVNIIKNADIGVIDSYLADVEFYKEIVQYVKIPVYIDDNNRINYPDGIVVNGTIYAKKLNFPKKTDTIYLIGKKFTLFRKEFWKVPKKYIRKNLSNILLFLGGCDSKSLTPRLLSLLIQEYPELDKNAIITTGFKNLDELKKINDKRTSFIVNPNAKEIKNLMFSSDISITTGGQTLYELARIGVPSIVISVADNQMKSIKDLEKSGLIEYAGDWKDNELTLKIKKNIEKLNSYKIRFKKSSKLRKIFDGKSTLYLVDKLINYYKKYEKGIQK